MLSEEERVVSLNSNPMYVLEQRKRYEHVTQLVGQLQRMSKAIGHYTQTGRQLLANLQTLISELGNMEFVATNPVFENYLGVMKAAEVGLSVHFTVVEDDSQSQIDRFVKDELPRLTESQRSYLRAIERFHTEQEKFLALSKKAKPKKTTRKLSNMSTAEVDAAHALFDFVHTMDKVESDIVSVVDKFMHGYSRTLADVTKDVFRPVGFESHASEDSTSDAIKPSIRVKRKSLSEALERMKRKMRSEYKGGDNKTQKQGYLWRKTKFGGWERMFCVCSSGVLSGSPTVETAHNPSWSLNLVWCSVQSNESEDRQNCFTIRTKDKAIVLQAPSVYDMGEWIDVIKNGIASVLITEQCSPKKSQKLGIPTSLSASQASFSLDVAQCADCKAKGATWLIVNKYLLVCDECAGIHRSLGQVSMIRSLTLDDIDKYTEKVLGMLPDNPLNLFLESNIGTNQIPVDAEFEVRSDFIHKKYVDLAFCDKDCEKDIYQAIQEHSLVDLLIAIQQGKLENGLQDTFTPMHAAACLGDPYLIVIMAQNSDQLNVLDEGGWSPLSYATYYQHFVACDTLLDLGANIFASRDAHPYLIARQLDSTQLIEKYQAFLQADMTGITDQPEFVPPNQKFKPDGMSWDPIDREETAATVDMPEEVEQDLDRALSTMSRKRRGTTTPKRKDYKILPL